MDNIGKEILEILKQSGKSASEITHALKFIGNGSMEAGLSKIGVYFQKEVKNGTMKGAIGGAIGGAIAGPIENAATHTDEELKKATEALALSVQEGATDTDFDSMKDFLIAQGVAADEAEVLADFLYCVTLLPAPVFLAITALILAIFSPPLIVHFRNITFGCG